MNNKTLGIIIVSASLLLIILLFFIRSMAIAPYEAEIAKYTAAGEACPSEPGLCPHEQKSTMQIPIFIAAALLLGVAALGLYLIFFEKSQQEVISELRQQKEMKLGDEKFSILLKGLSAEEQNIIKAVKEQDGITQQTLRLRTDLHKSKLSILLDGLEKKGLIKREDKGKTKQVFLRVNV
jgi:uncharacterized membrane protein